MIHWSRSSICLYDKNGISDLINEDFGTRWCILQIDETPGGTTLLRVRCTSPVYVCETNRQDHFGSTSSVESGSRFVYLFLRKSNKIGGRWVQKGRLSFCNISFLVGQETSGTDLRTGNLRDSCFFTTNKMCSFKTSPNDVSSSIGLVGDNRKKRNTYDECVSLGDRLFTPTLLSWVTDWPKNTRNLFNSLNTDRIIYGFLMKMTTRMTVSQWIPILEHLDKLLLVTVKSPP